MVAGLVLLFVLGLVSAGMTTKQQRAESRRKLARWNPLFIGLIVVQLAFIFWPRR